MPTRMSIALIVAAALCGPQFARVQAPDFSGRWILDPTQSLVNGRPRPPGGAGTGPVRVGGTIRPPAKVKDVRPAYPPGTQRDRIYRSSWDGGRLVTTIAPASTQPYESGSRPRTETRYREGDTMVVETVTPGPTPDAKPLVMKLVYKKAGL